MKLITPALLASVVTLTLLLAFASVAPAHAATTVCVSINNTTNRAAWTVQGRVTRASYTDYGDNLGYSRPVPRVVWAALATAEAKLHATAPGPKLARACTVSS